MTIAVDRTGTMPQIVVYRFRMEQIALDTIAAADMALAAIDRATALAFTPNRRQLVNELGRAGFEITAHRKAIADLAALAESAEPYCPDGIEAINHGDAA